MKYITPIDWKITPNPPVLLPSTGYAAALPRLFELSNTTPVSKFGVSYQFLDESLQFVDAANEARTFQKFDTNNGSIYTPKLPFHRNYYRVALEILQGVLRISEDGKTLYRPQRDGSKLLNIWRPIQSLTEEYHIPNASYNSEVEEYLIRMLTEQPQLNGLDLTVHTGVRVGSTTWFYNQQSKKVEEHDDAEHASQAWQVSFDPDWLDADEHVPAEILQQARAFVAWLTSVNPDHLDYDANYSNLLRTFRGNLLGSLQKHGSLWIGNGGNGKSLLLNQMLKDLGVNLTTKLDADALKVRGFEKSNAVASLAHVNFAIDDDADQDTKLDTPVLKSLTTGGVLRGRTIGHNLDDFISKAYAIVASNYIPTDQDANQVKRRWCFVKFRRSEPDFDHAPILPFLEKYGIIPMLAASCHQAVEDPASDHRAIVISNWDLLAYDERAITQAVVADGYFFKTPDVELRPGLLNKMGLRRKTMRKNGQILHVYVPDSDKDKWKFYAQAFNEHELDAED